MRKSAWEAKQGEDAGLEGCVIATNNVMTKTPAHNGILWFACSSYSRVIQRLSHLQNCTCSQTSLEFRHSADSAYAPNIALTVARCPFQIEPRITLSMRKKNPVIVFRVFRGCWFVFTTPSPVSSPQGEDMPKRGFWLMKDYPANPAARHSKGTANISPSLRGRRPG